MSLRVSGFSRSPVLLVALAGAASLLACRPSNAPVGAAVPAAVAASHSETHGIDLSLLDPTVRAGDNFFAYANGSWTKRTEIPADRSDWGVTAELIEETSGRLRSLLEGAAQGGSQRKVGDFYASFMDEGAIEGRGITALQPTLARIAALRERRDLGAELGRELRADVDPLNNTDFQTDRLFGLWVSPGFATPERNQPYLLQGGLGMPAREYYLDGSPRMQELRAKYQAHIASVLRLAGVADADAKAARVLALEAKMAHVHASREDSMDVRRADNAWPAAEFAQRAPGLDWGSFFRAAGLDQVHVFTVWHPQAVVGLSALVGTEPLQAWQDWLTFHAIDRRAGLLPKAFVEEDFAFYQKALNGTPQLRDRWKRGVSLTNRALGDAVGQLYVERYFPAASKAALQGMVQHIIEAFGRRIDSLDWMAPSTKAKARAKLSTLYVGVGYPDRWIDYGSLEIAPGDLIGNVERAELFLYRRSVAKLAQPVDKAEWWMAAQVVNALNLPLQNALNFPAAILVPPFFDPQAPAAVNYGAIGSVIGHEISHSFDDQGAQFDAGGSLADWWTPADRQHFEASGAALVAQFDAYQPFTDLHVNGKLTLGENIADLAGLAAAHDGWVAALGGQPAPVVLGLSGEQQFFLAYAQAWRGKQREEAQREQLITDGHAPDEYRAATVRNLDAWYQAFDVSPGQALYLAPEKRVKVW